MVIKKRVAPLRAKRPNQHQQAESTTTCAYCSSDSDIYQLGDGQWICESHLAASVSVAAGCVWPDMVSYSREFERVWL